MTLEVFGIWICILWSICIYLRLGRVLLRLDRVIELLAKIHDKDP